MTDDQIVSHSKVAVISVVLTGLLVGMITYCATVKARDREWIEAAFRNGVAVIDSDGGMSWKEPLKEESRND